MRDPGTEPLPMISGDVMELHHLIYAERAAAEGMRKALEATPCRCPVLLKCPHCEGDVVEGADQYSGSWICGACVKAVTLPKDPAYPCIRCAALAAWKEATRG